MTKTKLERLCLETLLEVRDFIGSEYESEEAKALDGEFVCRRAQPIWDSIHKTLDKLWDS